jgi:hypothetical protein
MTQQWHGRSRNAQREREERVSAAAAESRELVSAMSSAMVSANDEMRHELHDTGISLASALPLSLSLSLYIYHIYIKEVYIYICIYIYT